MQIGARKQITPKMYPGDQVSILVQRHGHNGVLGGGRVITIDHFLRLPNLGIEAYYLYIGDQALVLPDLLFQARLRCCATYPNRDRRCHR